MAFWSWSKTSASNATADVTINWAEGQSPSSVNDSARAMMARLAEYRDDVSASISTAGSSSAYTLTTNEGLLSTPTGNPVIGIFMHTTNALGCTLAVDGGTAYPILTSIGGSSLPAGTLISQSPYTLVYGSSTWILRNFYGAPASLIPIGALMPYTGSTAPNSSFVIPVGQAISRTTYSTYFGIVSTTYGVGDGSTTFNVPDLRGRAIFGNDSGGSGRITVAGGNYDGTVLGNTGGGQNETLTQAQLPALALAFSGNALGGGVAIAAGAVLSGTVGGSVNVPGSYSAITPTGNVTAAGSTTLGSGNAHTIMPPSMVMPYILRII